jgi:hypothetical protein
VATLVFFVLAWFSTAVAFVGFWEVRTRGPADGMLFAGGALVLLLGALMVGLPGGSS